MKIIERISFLVMVFSVSISCMSSDAHMNDNVKKIIVDIEKDVHDLTAPLSLFHSPYFVSAREKTTVSECKELVTLVENKQLTTNQSIIAVYLIACAVYKEDYWDVVLPLVSTNTSENLLCELLAPVPFGPGYSDAIDIQRYEQKLRSLRNSANIGDETKNCLDNILSGEAKRKNNNFLSKPDEYNLDPWVLSCIGKSWQVAPKSLHQDIPTNNAILGQNKSISNNRGEKAVEGRR